MNDWTSKEVLIVIPCSSLSVILIIITAAMVIIKANPKCKTSQTKEKLEMLGTGSSAQSECSACTSSTNINSEHLVNFQRRFENVNPESQLPDLLGRSGCYEPNVGDDTTLHDPNHNTVQQCEYNAVPDPSVKSRDCAISHSDMKLHCACNIRYNPPAEAYQCRCDCQKSKCHLQSNYKDGRFTCDV